MCTPHQHHPVCSVTCRLSPLAPKPTDWASVGEGSRNLNPNRRPTGLEPRLSTRGNFATRGLVAVSRALSGCCIWAGRLTGVSWVDAGGGAKASCSAQDSGVRPPPHAYAESDPTQHFKWIKAENPCSRGSN